MPDPPGAGRYAIATPHAAATDAGRAVFEAGGNAADAALAAACVLVVVYPHMCSIGGDVMALVHDGRMHAINGSGRSPAALESAPPSPRDIATITVPGAPSAWQAIAERWGSRPIALAIEEAARLAADGVPVARSLANALRAEPELVSADPGMAHVFAPSGAVLAEGDLLIQDALATTLRRLAEHGPGDFYEGGTAASLISGLAERGCRLSSGDLAAHRTDVEEALRYADGDREINTMGPNSQGYSLVQMLAAVDVLGLADPLRTDAPLLAAVFDECIADRDRHLADAGAMQVAVETLLTDGHVAALAHRAAAGRAESSTAARSAHGDTIAVVASDASGLAVSLIQSVFYAFGSGVLEPRTGVLLHNRGACFSADRGSPNAFGPAKRPLHTLLPLIVSKAGRPTWIAGTMGGHAQPQIHAQMLLRLRGGAGGAAVVGAPRMIVGDLETGAAGPGIRVEDDFEGRDALTRAGLEPVVVDWPSETVGHAQAIAIGPNGAFDAASDPRSDGTAFAP
jgi:gamma-glutamyltranspeptidase